MEGKAADFMGVRTEGSAQAAWARVGSTSLLQGHSLGAVAAITAAAPHVFSHSAVPSSQFKALGRAFDGLSLGHITPTWLLSVMGAVIQRAALLVGGSVAVLLFSPQSHTVMEG